MKALLSSLLCFFFVTGQVTYAQSSSINRVQFFNDTSIVNATIATDIGNLLRQKKQAITFRAPLYLRSRMVLK
jgi:hypothetical protein